MARDPRPVPAVRLTVACFLAYCVMSGMLSPIGIVLPPLAEFTGLPLTDAAELFSWLTLGILVGSALSLVVFDVLSLRGAMNCVYAAITGAIVVLYLAADLVLIRLALGLIGVGCGIGLAAAASVISLLYHEDRRASMLVITDGAFSISGAAISSLAVALVAAGWHWSAPYLLLGALALTILLIAATSAFPEPEATAPGASIAVAPWPAAVWLCIAALFLYTLGQYSLLWWLPTHLEESLAIPRDAAGVVVSRFWTGMLIGQLFVAWWVLRVGARRLVLLSVAATFLMSLPLWQVSAAALLPWLALAWGVANLGLLKVVIAFASLAVPVPSPRLIAALLFGATSGTAISPVVTSALVEAAGTLRVLQFGSGCYFVLALLVLLAHRLSAPRRQTPMENPGLE